MASDEQPIPFLYVKNTFIEVAEPPPLQRLLRASTMPAQTIDDEDSESDSDSKNEESQSPGDAQHPVEPDEAHGAAESKMITCDGYEPTREWLWTESEMPPEADWVVKNTFLEFGPSPDQLAEPVLIRHRSAPAPVTMQKNSEVEVEKTQRSSGAATETLPCDEAQRAADTTYQATPSSAGYSAPSPHVFGAGPPPQIPELERVTTMNDYDYDPGMLPANPMMPMGLPAPYAPGTEGQAIPMMMLPAVTYVMQEGPQGQSVMVPVGRFGAFPETPASQPEPCGPSVPAEQTDVFAKLDLSKPPIDKPPLLQRHKSVSTQLFRFRWNLEESLLKRSDREKVSPPLEMDVGGVTCCFKMVVKPKEISDSRGGRSFKKAKGKGTIEVHCTDQPDSGINMKFVVAVGKSGASSFTEQSTAIDHDFANKHICGVPNEFDFQAAVDETLQQFCVSLQVMARPVC